MAITENDVRLYASERMTDFSDGGGAMSPTVIVDGLDNNVFPDVTDIDRLSGRSSVRKIFGAVISADTDTYLSAHALIDDAADDSAVDALLLSYGGYETERAGVVSEMGDGAIEAGQITFTTAPGYEIGVVAASGGTVVQATVTSLQTFFLPAGTLLSLTPVAPPGPTLLRTLVSLTYVGSDLSVTLDTPVTDGVFYRFRRPVPAHSRCYGVGVSAAGASSGASNITVGRVFSRAIPADLAAVYPTIANPSWLVHPSFYSLTQGQVQVIQPNDPLLIHSTVAMAPDTVANTDVVDTTRVNLSRLRVIGSNGVEHARFTLGVPAPSGVGCTADLAAGTVTFSDVSGMSQPVTVEHRIEEMALASAVSVGTGVITLNRALSRAYPAGTKVSSLCMLGDLQGRVIGGFAQSAWTGVFSDTVLGGTPTADFNDAVYPITTTNQGSITDRWTIIFTNTTAFRCIGELTGEISGGSTGVAYAPINPATGVPYFTIPALGWGSGWSAGNVYRFNTSGANAPLWLIRTVAPSAPGGSDSVTVEFRGYVNT